MPATAKSLPVPLRRVVSGLLLTAWVLLAAAALSAQTAEPVLVRDFAPGSAPYSLAPRQLATAGGLLYFSGQDPVHGTEPWVSDGSAAGTRRLADLCLGLCSSEPAGFTELGSMVLFYASTGNGNGIFRIVGSRAEKIVSAVEYLSGWARLGSHLYYLAGPNTLFETDGTPEGTRQIADLRAESCDPYTLCSQPEDFKAVAGAIYFVARGQLYRLLEGGTPQAILPLVSAQGFTALDTSRVIFQGCTGAQGTGCQAYVTDGTSAGTQALDGDTAGGASQFLAWRGRVYFQKNIPTPPYYRIVSTDGTVAGTRFEPGEEYRDLVAATPDFLFYSKSNELYAVDASGQRSAPLNSWGVQNLVGQLGDKIFYTYGDPGGIARPGFTRFAVSNGRLEGTQDLLEGFASAGGVVLGGRLYFSRNLSNPQSGLWRSDGSLAGTAQVSSPSTAARSSYPKPHGLGHFVVAETRDPDSNSSDPFLWRIDSATLGSELVDPEPRFVRAVGRQRMFFSENGSAESRLFAYDGENQVELPITGLIPNPLVTADDHLFFFTDVAQDLKLWESDGSAAVTRTLIEFPPPPGTCQGFCGPFTGLAASDDLVFYYASPEAPINRPRFSVWDRKTNEKRVLLDPAWLYPLPISFPGGKALLWRDNRELSRQEWWISDGTAAGTQPFFIVPEDYGVPVSTVVGQQLWLLLAPYSGGPATLWTSNGTPAGTRPTTMGEGRSILRILPGTGGRAYLVGYSAATGVELGYADGTSTRWLDLRPGPESSIVDLFYLPWYHVLADGRLVFAAHADEAGYEPWISDGTAAGTYRLADVNPGEDASSPGEFAEAGGRLFFQASHPDSGRELWSLELPPRFAPCPAGRACLFGNRFEVEVTAHTADGDFVGKLATSTPESGIFTFFSADNWEMLVKVLDGCNQNGKHWVFAAGATDVEFTLRVQDRATGLEKVYRNAGGQAARAITDTDAFSCN